MTPIGWVNSCFPEKFGIPRQPRLVTAATAELVLPTPYGSVESVQGLEHYSHLWVLFLFHQTQGCRWRSRVRPPRLGGNRRIGLWASRSMFRPNPIGLSVVRLEQIQIQRDRVVLQVSGHDWVDQTPILDIKPYLPFIDAVAEATSSGPFAEPPAAVLAVQWSEAARQAEPLWRGRYPEFPHLLEQVLAQDPRPAYQRDSRSYGLRLYDLNIRWRVEAEGVWIESIEVWSEAESIPPPELDG